MDVGGDDGEQEQETVEDEVFVGTAQERDCQWWEEDVEERDDDAFE